MTIRANSNNMETVNYTLGYTNNIPLTDCFVSQNKHIGRIVNEIIAKMDQIHTERKEGAEKDLISSWLREIGPFTDCRHFMVFPLVEETLGLRLVLMASVYLSWPYFATSVRMERDGAP